jgi:two-component system response regulator RegA
MFWDLQDGIGPAARIENMTTSLAAAERRIVADAGRESHLSAPRTTTASLAGRTVLVLDDDALLRHRVGSALASRGFEPILAGTSSDAMSALRSGAPAFAVIEPRLTGGSGLAVVDALRRSRPESRIVILTGHGSIAAAVAAVKAGAADYLTKPAEADELVSALLGAADDAPPPLPDRPMSATRVRWEHIHRVHQLCGHNVSETARRLRMHRRTLQRILQKRAPR